MAVELLKDFRGAVQSDGYGAYDIYENKQGVLLLGCWAHVRRKFEHALAEDPERAEYALRVIGQLYALERQMKELELPPDEVKALREKEAYPIIREFEKWLERETSSTTPQSSIGKAVRYAYALYPRMACYVTDDRTASTTTERRMPYGRWHWGVRTVNLPLTVNSHVHFAANAARFSTNSSTKIAIKNRF